LLTNVVGTAAPLSKIVDVPLKLTPFTSRRSGALPAATLEGERDSACGAGFTGLFTVNVNTTLVPPPGAGLLTEILNAPGFAKSFAGNVVCRFVALTNVVGAGDPFNRMPDEALKLFPLTVSVTAGLPTKTLGGESTVAAGTGLFTVNDMATDGELPGLDTVTSGVPATAMALAGIEACSCVALTNIETTVAPLKATSEIGVKLLPVTDRVKPIPPAVVLGGTRPSTTGCPLAVTIVSVKALEVPPALELLAGFVTVMVAVPGFEMSLAVTAMVSFMELTKVVC
jgi:hypothetical protein